MLKKFYPKQYVDSAYWISYETLFQKGIRGVIYDIDNTLAKHDEPADEKAVALFEVLRKKGIATCLLSNNKEPRVKAFGEKVGSAYIYKGGKPSIKNYIKAMEIMGTDKKSTVFIGDQLFTDIYGANRTGIYSILVKPINPKEEIQIVIKRFFERVVLYFYKKDCKKRDQRHG